MKVDVITNENIMLTNKEQWMNH